MKRTLVILLLALLIPFSATAQRGKSSSRNKKAKKEEVTEDPRITQMLTAVRQIMFVDSMVVDKNNFISHIPLSAECGKLAQAGGLGQFTNELNDHRLTTVFDTSDSLFHITESDFIGDEWTKPAALKGIDQTSANFPYIMPDGITLYYAQQGEKSIGGYDLFVTRYDADTGTYLKGENLGMPFSSEANDYLYVIDEANQLGYFVTDRRQPSDKVCIYVFVPDESRKTYVPEAYTDQQIRSLARIDSISATWTDKKLRQQALNRLDNARSDVRKNAQKNNGKRPSSELEDLYHQAEVLEKALLLARNYYARASESDRATLRNEILNSEQELEQLQLTIKQKEKELRNKQYQ